MISNWRAARLRNVPNSETKRADNTLAGENRGNMGKSHVIKQIRICENHSAAHLAAMQRFQDALQAGIADVSDAELDRMIQTLSPAAQ